MYIMNKRCEFKSTGFNLKVVDIEKSWQQCNILLANLPCNLWPGLSKTTISTLIGDLLCDHIPKNNQFCCVVPHEKGSPDIIPKTYTIKDTVPNTRERRYPNGLEIKISSNDGWSAHHADVKNLLGGIWHYTPTPQIVGLFYIDKLSKTNFSQKQETQYNRNTPSCSIKGDFICVGVKNTADITQIFQKKKRVLKIGVQQVLKDYKNETS